MTTTVKKVRTNVYLDAIMKEKAQEVFKTYGMGLSDAFNIFLSQSVMEKGIPFQIKIPNKETLQAMQDVEAGIVEEISFEDHLEEIKQCIRD
jgi:DNA-damage-inducible protein J